jgi:hypothetical protein
VQARRLASWLRGERQRLAGGGASR